MRYPAGRTLRPVDQVDRTVGAVTGLLDRRRHGRDVQHAPAIGQHALAVGAELRAGMENLHALYLAGGIEAADLGALLVGIGIAVGGHDHRQRAVVGPAQVEVLQPAVGAGDQRRHEIGLEPHHHHLALGIAEAAVVLEDLRALRRDHQPGIEHALERHAVRGHGARGRQDDLVHGALLHGRVEDRRRRIGAHAAGIGPLVVVEGTLVVLRGDQRQDVLAVTEREEAHLLADQEFLDHDRGAGRAEAVARQHVARRLDRLLDRLGHDDALAGGKAIGFHDDRRALCLDVGGGLVGVGEALIGAGRDVVALAQLLGEALRALELSRLLRGAEHLYAGLGKAVRQAHRQRHLRAHHHEIDLFPLGQRHLARDVLGGDVNAFGHLGNAGIAGGAV